MTITSSTPIANVTPDLMDTAVPTNDATTTAEPTNVQPTNAPATSVADVMTSINTTPKTAHSNFHPSALSHADHHHG